MARPALAFTLLSLLFFVTSIIQPIPAQEEAQNQPAPAATAAQDTQEEAQTPEKSSESAEKKIDDFVTPEVLIDRAEALRLAEKATAENFPDADEVVICQSIDVNYRHDGTYTQLDEGFIKILTEKSRRDNSTISSYFTIPYQLEGDCRILLVEVIKPDGTATQVDLAKHTALVVDTSSMSSNIYNPNDKIIRVNVPDLQIGDILHYYMYDNTRQPRAQGIFADIIMFEDVRPIIRKEAAFSGPEDFPLVRTAIRDPQGETISHEKTTADGRNTYRWRAENVAQAFPEPNTPRLYSCLQRLLVSTAPDWPTISRWYWDLSKDALAQTTPNMKETVEGIVKGLQTPQEKIEAVFRWVRQEVRSMGITVEETSPGYAPHPVKDTFNDRHGVCRDKAALLVAMLRLAGIEAFPVLINNGEKKDTEVAAPFFNHAITAAMVGEGYILMDSTDENTKQLLPSYLDDKSYLVATPRGEELRTSAIVPAAQNLMRIETTGELDGAGNLSLQSVLHFDGINDNIYRGYFSRITPAERRQHFESRIKDIYGEVRLDDFQILPQNMLDTSVPLKVTMRFSAQGVLVRGLGAGLLPMPFMGSRFGMINFVLNRTGLEKRRFPLDTEVACGVEESIRITLPQGLSRLQSMPVYKPVEDGQMSWSRSLAVVDKSLMGRSSFLLNTVEFSPAQYLQLKDNLRQIEYYQRTMPVFALAPESAPGEQKRLEEADVLTVEDETTCVILNPGEWVETRKVRKKVLTYAGVKDNSELKIDYNPVWEKIEVTAATVTSSTGKISSISPKEINIMDQPWNGKAPRYPGGKTLVASLPGVDIGSTIQYTIRREATGRDFFSLSEPFADFDPIAQKSLIVTYPAGMAPLKHDIFDIEDLPLGQFAPFENLSEGLITGGGQNENNNTIVLRWSADSTGGVKREHFLPPWGSFTPTVYLSGGDWKGFAEMVRTTLTGAAQNQPESAALAQKLAAGIADPRQKIVAIRDHIARTVRLAGPDFPALPLSLVSPADETLADQYGNTTDRAVLFHAVLKAAGFTPELFLVTRYQAARNLHLPQLELANPDAFTHVLVRVRPTPDAPYIWLNDTDQYDQPGTTPSEGSRALDLASAEFVTIAAAPELSTQSELICTIELNTTGGARIRMQQQVFGPRYGALKKMFAEMTPEQFRRFQQEELAKVAQSARPEGEFKVDFNNYPGMVDFTCAIPNYAVRDGEYLYLELPQTLRRIFRLQADARTNPLFVNQQGRQRISTVIVLPKDLPPPLIAPRDFKWRAPSGSSRLEVATLLITPAFLRGPGIGGPLGQVRAQIVPHLSAGNNVLLVTQEAVFEPTVYPAAFYPDLLQAQNALSGNYSRTVLFHLAPKPETPQR